MNQNNISQDSELWGSQWSSHSPETEIHKWDFYGLRPWILKYTSRYGKSIEAGCGLGRWVFYLSSLGIDIEGIDFSKSTIDYLNEWKIQNKFNPHFFYGDVTNLSFEDNSLSGYISLGVVEHFIEGPKTPLEEAFRVLRPGGVAIITTPSISWLQLVKKIKKKSKNIIKKIMRREIVIPPFFQYEYRPRKLKNFVNDSGLHVTSFSGTDLLYTFCELGNFYGRNLKKGSFAYWFSNTFENTFIRTIGAQSVTISVKLDDIMYCFLCGHRVAARSSLDFFSVPICKECELRKNSTFYKNKKAKYNFPYFIDPPKKKC